MAFGHVTSWQRDGETMETVTDFIFLGFKIAAAMKLKDTASVTMKVLKIFFIKSSTQDIIG